MKPKYQTITFFAKMEKVDTGTFITKMTDCCDTVDISDYAVKLQNACIELDAEGYDIISVTPLNTAKFANNAVGVSVTQGAAVVGRLKSDHY